MKLNNNNIFSRKSRHALTLKFIFIILPVIFLTKILFILYFTTYIKSRFLQKSLIKRCRIFKYLITPNKQQIYIPVEGGSLFKNDGGSQKQVAWGEERNREVVGSAEDVGEGKRQAEGTQSGYRGEDKQGGRW